MARRLIVLLGVAATVSACSAGREAVWERDGQKLKAPAEAGTPAAEANATLMSDADAAWSQRTDRAQLEAAIAAWEKLIEQNGEDGAVLAKLSRAYYLLGDGYMRLAGEDGMEQTLEKGVEYGERAMMAMSPQFAERVRAEEKVEDAVQSLEKNAMGAVYWYASNLGKFAAEKGFTTQLFYKDRIVAVMTRVLELDPEFFYAAPHRYFGAFYAKAPAFAGGDMDKSREHFDISIQKHPEYLGTKVLLADFWAVKQDDKALFMKMLDEVLAADPNAVPELVAENRIEQEKARQLKAKVDELF
ncbi:MAG: TRAP transporter TatT component family protein [Myxococcota bacterium]